MALTLVSPAYAQEPGVTVDPRSPSSKEYALPLEAARRDATGKGDAPIRPGERSSTLFGEGASREAGSEKSSSRGRSPAAEDRGTGTRSEDGGGIVPTGAGSASPEATTERSGVGSTTALALGGLGVLILTLLGGLALRALRGPG